MPGVFERSEDIATADLTDQRVIRNDGVAMIALIEELLRRGYSEQDISKICGENLLRVWSEVERTAAELQF